MQEFPDASTRLPQDSTEFAGLEPRIQVLRIREAFEAAWQSDRPPRISDFLRGLDESLAARVVAMLVVDDRDQRSQRGLPWSLGSYLTELPEYEAGIRESFESDSTPNHMDETVVVDPGFAESPDSSAAAADGVATVDQADSPRTAAVSEELIGPYRLRSKLGQGAFGEVYLAIDQRDSRPVAVKLARDQSTLDAAATRKFLEEAEVLAEFQHPHIVRCLDAGVDDSGRCYMVSQLIDGGSLDERLKAGPLPRQEAVCLLISVAEALHAAHQKAIVHRDVKPANILLDTSGTPYLADFGMALTDAEYGSGQLGQIAGTLAYMSPEQARGESHLVDGRTDIYALGVILYEMLTRRRPVQEKRLNDPGLTDAQRRALQLEFLRRICEVEIRPPRQLDDTIPLELERICLKSLSKRASERYSTSRDLADDLRAFLEQPASEVGSAAAPAAVRIVPKGLRSFNEHDADFFLELLPGPRDRTGLPDSLRFWKTQIEQTDGDETFRVGLIIGPSGCGKSSLVKAGLIPRLTTGILPLYIEASSNETETRLMHGLRKRCPSLPADSSLQQMLSALRTDPGLSGGRKVLLVIDQFEQWLHAQHDADHSPLVEALRQCDGGRVQCIVMVREDFWMAVTRFLRELEVPQVEGLNVAAVDLFPEAHARKTLTAFGRAFGTLGSETEALSEPQAEFIERCVAGLAEDGKVICVRLALFAEMVKGKPWTPATLADVGGTQGIGVTFLEETFSSSSAPPEHRLHQKAARSILKSLLPDSGTDIKGHWRSRAELLGASGYAQRPRDFDDVLRILDAELRLITPTDPEGQQLDDEETESSVATGGQYYQLTHDYLVPSLRDWLTRKQQETRRGRAELRLETRTAEWTRQPLNRRLPAWWEFLNIRCFTRKRDWTAGQRRMMRKAGTVHGIQAVLLTLLLTMSGWATWEFSGRARGEALVSSLLNAQADRIPELLAELPAVERWALPLLQTEIAGDAESVEDRRRQLHARLALVADDPQHVEPLVESLLSGPWAYVTVIRDQLPVTTSLQQQLWTELRDDSPDKDRRLKAAMALAPTVESADTWSDGDRQFVVDHLLASNPEFQPTIRAALRSRRDDFLPLVEQRFQNPVASEAVQQSTTAALVDWAGDQPQRLTEALTWARPTQWPDLLAAWKSAQGVSDLDRLLALADQQPDESLSSNDRITLGQRRANAAIALALTGNLDGIVSVMQVDDDPEALSQFAAHCRGYGLELNAVLSCFDQVEQQRAGLSDAELKQANRALYGLLLSLGEYELDAVPSERREALIAQLADWYGEDPSSTIHGATGWLLRRWGQAELVQKVDQTPVAYVPGREWYTVEVQPVKDGLGQAIETTQIYYFTFVVFEPGEFELGSPTDEAEHEDDETQHRVRITRPFAVLDREVTRGEFEASGSTFTGYESKSPTAAHPMNGPSWFDAVRFSRWLTEESGLSESDQCYPPAGSLEPPLERYPLNSGDQQPPRVPLNLDGGGFRLPTESEWEWACRGGARTAYGFGGDPELLPRYAWMQSNSGELTQIAGKSRPNLRGLSDMHGNLWEWCHDWTESERSREVLEDPTGPATGSNRVYRGGSWINAAGHCRSSNRFWSSPSVRNDYLLGFRLAAVPSSK